MRPNCFFNPIFCITVFNVLILSINAQDVKRFNFVPYVIRSDRTEPVKFEALITGNPTGVTFEYDGIDRMMVDDGSGNDAEANDSLYTITFEAREITGKLTVEDVFRPFIGYCKIYQGNNLRLRMNVFAEIWTNEIPRSDILSIDTTMQAASNIVNIKGKVPLGIFDTRPWTQKFYSYFKDDYDFLNFIIIPSLRGNRYHFAVKNGISGIGMTIFDATYHYGNTKNLQGINVFPISYLFDGAGRAYQHELSHQWINFLRDTPLGTASPHWPMGNIASGIIGINLPGGVGGSFDFDIIPEGDKYRLVRRESEPDFNDIELYLMGLLEPGSVKPYFIFDNQNQNPSGDGLLEGPITHIYISDIIESVGPRIPAYTYAQKSFRLATIVISEKLLTQEEMSFFNYFSKRAELREQVSFSSGFAKGIAKPFYISTGRRGELNTKIGDQISTITSNTTILRNYELCQNYPNPFNASTIIQYSIPSSVISTTEGRRDLKDFSSSVSGRTHPNDNVHVVLKVYDLLGNEVSLLVNRHQEPGTYQVEFDVNKLPSGMYFYKLEADNFVETKKMVLIK